ncbi:hypothetical protein GGD66_006423 [Bradyrhizobium sp. CIR48]|nr:hypothetical protein [Bradyrhizobium sp. CIR48]
MTRLRGGSPFGRANDRILEPKMSRGMPSMTALLGMLAIAGYQNRDKLAEMFRNATSGQPAAGNKDSLGGMLGNLGGLVGGGGVRCSTAGSANFSSTSNRTVRVTPRSPGSITGRTGRSRRPNLGRRSVRMSCRSWNSRPDCRSRRYSIAWPASCRQPWTNTRPTDGFLLRLANATRTWRKTWASSGRSS